jgi:hypothetical protein
MRENGKEEKGAIKGTKKIKEEKMEVLGAGRRDGKPF